LHACNGLRTPTTDHAPPNTCISDILHLASVINYCTTEYASVESTSLTCLGEEIGRLGAIHNDATVASLGAQGARQLRGLSGEAEGVAPATLQCEWRRLLCSGIVECPTERGALLVAHARALACLAHELEGNQGRSWAGALLG
jgi:hypothetical protein